MSSSALVTAAAVTCAVLGTATGVRFVLAPPAAQSAIAPVERTAPVVPVAREIPSLEKEDTVQKGFRLYRQICAKCHGPNMVNPGTASFDLRKFPEEDPDRFVTSVTKGKGRMPAHGDILKAGEVQALWAYVKTKGKV